MKQLTVAVISDSSGEAPLTEARISVSQFKDVKGIYKRFPFVTTRAKLQNALRWVIQNEAMIFYTLVSPQLNKIICSFSSKYNIYTFDCLRKPVELIKDKLDVKPTMKTGMAQRLTSSYFDRINAISFSVEHDDGKLPNGLLQADIVILGPSRTSKTPLSLYLADKGLKTMNLPISPSTQLPKQVWKVNPKHMFGLLNSVQLLQKIRATRIKSYGLPVSDKNPYLNSNSITNELTYAKKLYKKIGCKEINVSNKSIEETATIVLEDLNINNPY